MVIGIGSGCKGTIKKGISETERDFFIQILKCQETSGRNETNFLNKGVIYINKEKERSKCS